MKLRRITLFAALTFLVASVAASEGQAGGATPITACGQVVTTDAFLTGNLICAGTSGIVVGADGITIDLKGFTIRGDRALPDYGIDDQFHDGLTVTNGVVRNFFYGVAALGADGVSVSNLLASGNAGDGILVSGASAVVKSSTADGNNAGIHVNGNSARILSSTAFGNNNDGIEVDGDSAHIRSSTANGNRFDGISVFGDFAKIQSSTASGNQVPNLSAAGIYVQGDAPRIDGNRTEGNGFSGGTASDLVGLGIQAVSYTTAPVGANVARGNDDPSECSPAPLC